MLSTKEGDKWSATAAALSLGCSVLARAPTAAWFHPVYQKSESWFSLPFNRFIPSSDMHYKKLSFPYFFFYCVPKITHLTSSPPQVKITEGTCCWITRQNSQKNPFPTHQLAPTGCCAVSNSSALPPTHGYCQLKFQPKPIEW